MQKIFFKNILRPNGALIFQKKEKCEDFEAHIDLVILLSIR
jgi:hypothetical protein